MNTTEFAKKIFGASNISSLQPINYNYSWRYKIAVYVPAENSDALAFTMASSGAGKIGNYSVCSFRTKGVGTFIGGKASNPVIGKKNKFEMVDEVRLEMICDEVYLDEVIDAMYEVHPYEEPAYEIYPVMIRAKKADTEILAVSFKKRLFLKDVLAKMNKNINSELLTSYPGKQEVWSAIIDFTDGPDSEHETHGRKKVLYIKKVSKSLYNISLV